MASTSVPQMLEQQRVEAARLDLEYVFTVIVPIYNTAEYLEECILSIVNQTIGFGDTQLILVDDGSTDDSPSICSHYAELFPRNVVFLHQQNAGVSAARNLGLERVRGLWINFLDSDDMWSLDAFEVALRFCNTHAGVKIISERHWFFGAFEGPHPLDYKYYEDRVVDILKEPDAIQMSLSNTFVRSELLEDQRFDVDLDFAEDFRIMGPLMLRERYLGICKRGSYRYRKRVDGGSAIDTTTQKMSYYEETPYKCNLNLFEKSMHIYGEVVPYAQWCVMYELQFRLRTSLNPSLSKEAVDCYDEVLHRLLDLIEDEIIVSQRHMSPVDKLYALAFKYKTSVGQILDSSYQLNRQLYWRHNGLGTRLFPIDAIGRMIYIDCLSYYDGYIHVAGWCDCLCEDARPLLRIVFRARGIDYEVSYDRREDQRIWTLYDSDRVYRQGLTVDIPWSADGRIAITARVEFCGWSQGVWLAFDKSIGLDERLEHTYCEQDGVLFRVQSAGGGRNKIVANPKDLAHHVVFWFWQRRESGSE